MSAADEAAADATRRLRTDPHPLWARVRLLLRERGLDSSQVAVAFGYDAGEAEARIGLVYRDPEHHDRFVDVVSTLQWAVGHVDEAVFTRWEVVPDESPWHHDWPDHFASARAMLDDQDT